jgi:hypothetical protein
VTNKRLVWERRRAAPACCQKGPGFHAGEMCSGLFTFLRRLRAGLEHGENSGNLEKSGKKTFAAGVTILGLVIVASGGPHFER